MTLNKSLRIALVSPYTLPFACGNSILAERLREGLTARGHEVALFNAALHDPTEAVRFSPHVLHTFNAERSYQWMRKFREQAPATRWVITLTGTDYNSWSGKMEPPPHVRESLELANALVVFHDEAYESLTVALPEVRHKIAVIPQAVTVLAEKAGPREERAQYGIDSNALIFLMVSGIRPVKNIGTAIEAFMKVEREIREALLILVGPVMDHEEGHKVFDLAASLRCFRYLGALPQQEVRKVMQGADVFINTSLSEGMAGAILEAMAEGLPIIASAVPGNRSLVKDGVNGLLFPPGTTEVLSEAAVTLAQNPSLRKTMGDTNRSIVAERHTPERELDGHERIYEALR